MEPLSSKVLNDQIVSMRKEVRRAVVHQIHHLTTAAKRLRSKNGTDEQKKQNASKADIMASEIKILKKIKPDDVSVFGLTNFDEPELKNFICKQIIAPETKTMAKLCLRKNLRSVIDEFIAAYLTVSELDMLGKLLDERFSNKKKKKKKKVNKKQKNNKKMLEHSGAKESASDSGDSSPELLSAALSDSDMDSSNEKKNLSSDNETEQTDKIDLDSDDIHQSHEAKKGGKKPAKKQKSNLKSLGSKSISGENCSETNAKNSLDSQNNRVEDKLAGVGEVENKDLKRKNIDPFFITRDNSEYRTYCNIDANSKMEQEKNSGEDHSQSRDVMNGFANRKERRNNSFGRNNQHQKFNNKRTITHLGGSQKSFASKRKSDFGKHPPPEDSSANVKLHPSWEAKKKLSLPSVPFEGKKITFEG